jgi:hypothetical protein
METLLNGWADWDRLVAELANDSLKSFANLLSVYCCCVNRLDNQAYCWNASIV